MAETYTRPLTFTIACHFCPWNTQRTGTPAALVTQVSAMLEEAQYHFLTTGHQTPPGESKVKTERCTGRYRILPQYNEGRFTRRCEMDEGHKGECGPNGPTDIVLPGQTS